MTSFFSEKSHPSNINNKNSAGKKSGVSREYSVWRDSVAPQIIDKLGVLESKHRVKMSDASGLQFAPLRPLDDFILGSARFQLPNFSDFEKWGNRVVKNLCYYQTNYLIVIGAWLILSFVYQPKVAIYSTGIIVGSLFAAKFCIEQYGTRGGSAKENLKYLLATFGPAILLMYLMDLIVFTLLVVLVPFWLIFVHASLRLRNLKNKVMNAAESLGIQNTPMGIFLNEMGLLPEGVLS